MSKSVLTVNHLGEQVSAEHIVKVLAMMLGWGNTPPWHVLEKDVRAKVVLLEKLAKEQVDLRARLLRHEHAKPDDDRTVKELLDDIIGVGTRAYEVSKILKS